MNMMNCHITTFLNNKPVLEYHGCFDIEFDENDADLWFCDNSGDYRHVRHEDFDAVLIKDEAEA